MEKSRNYEALFNQGMKCSVILWK